jgi:DNA-binding NtrC family response regulator
MARILIAETDPNIRQALMELFERLGHHVSAVEDGKKAIASACSLPNDLVILDLTLPKLYALRGLKTIREECPDLPVLTIIPSGSTGQAVDAMKLGASDYVTKPINEDEIRLRVEHILDQCQLINHNRHLVAELSSYCDIDNSIGAGPAARDAHLLASQIAKTDSAVLICGEKGVGKEHLARAIHRHSKRAEGPFVKVNCSALSDEAIEQKLFGQENDGVTRRFGCLDIAHGGTIFIAEIALMDHSMQEKLHQAVTKKQFIRCGGAEEVKSDVRLVVASSFELDDQSYREKFHDCLRKVLSKSVIKLPPLRERREDIPAFVDHFIKKHSAEIGKPVFKISDAAIGQILDCEWHGNMLELENCIERSIILCDGDCIQPAHLALGGSAQSGKRKMQGQVKSLRDVERDHIKKVLTYCNWNRSAAASILEVDRKTLRSKIREFGFTPPPGK